VEVEARGGALVDARQKEGVVAGDVGAPFCPVLRCLSACFRLRFGAGDDTDSTERLALPASTRQIALTGAWVDAVISCRSSAEPLR